MTNWITTYKDLKQGDLLSPLLFILGVDILPRIMERATSKEVIKEISEESTVGKNVCLQFADDTLVFSKADVVQKMSRHSAKTIHSFCQCRGIAADFIHNTVRIECNHLRRNYSILSARHLRLSQADHPRQLMGEVTERTSALRGEPSLNSELEHVICVDL